MNKLLSLSAVLVVVGATSCGRGDPMERGGRMLHQRVDAAMRDINATPDQKQQATTLTDDVIAKAKSVLDDGQKVRDVFVEQWRTDAPDKALLHARIDAHVEQLKGLLYTVVDDALELHRSLSKEQREQLVQRAESKRMK